MYAEVINTYLCKAIPNIDRKMFTTYEKDKFFIAKTKTFIVTKNGVDLPYFSSVVQLSRTINVSCTTVYTYLNQDREYVDRFKNSYKFCSI